MERNATESAGSLGCRVSSAEASFISDMRDLQRGFSDARWGHAILVWKTSPKPSGCPRPPEVINLRHTDPRLQPRLLLKDQLKPNHEGS